MKNLQKKMSDPELYALCKKWGADALEARRKFIGLLPEVNARRLYERRNFRSIYHFAAILGGVSEQLVNDVLRLERRFEEMPRLHAALVKGEIGLSKLARIASVVEVRNEGEICEKIRTLSRRAVDVLVKEIKMESEGAVEHDGLFERENEVKSLAGQNHDFEILNALSPEVKMKLKELLDKEIDINEIILEALAGRNSEIVDKEEEIGVEVGRVQSQSRHIPVKIRKILKMKFGSKCADSDCRNCSEHIHHEKPFVYYAEHDPRRMKPLCRGHHELEHAA